MHTSGYEYAVKNGYKRSKQEWLDGLYESYRAICSRCGIWPADYDGWVLITFAESEVGGGEA